MTERLVTRKAPPSSSYDPKYPYLAAPPPSPGAYSPDPMNDTLQVRQPLSNRDTIRSSGSTFIPPQNAHDQYAYHRYVPESPTKLEEEIQQTPEYQGGYDQTRDYEPKSPQVQVQHVTAPLALRGRDGSEPPPDYGGGMQILPIWRRHLLTWILLFWAIVFFVFTIIFAWNATGGEHANTRLLFEDPGKTVLVLQILTNVTTALFGELAISASEMLRWALATTGTKFTTFLGLSRATPLWGRLFLLLSTLSHFSTRLWMAQRLIIYLLVFTSSFILLSSLTIPTSFPVLISIANGTSGLGPFGSTDPTFVVPAFHFSGFLQDTTQVWGLPAPSTCDPSGSGGGGQGVNGCFSYFLPGGLDIINNTCTALAGNNTAAQQLCPLVQNGLSSGDDGLLGSIIGTFPGVNQPSNSGGSTPGNGGGSGGGDTNLTNLFDGLTPAEISSLESLTGLNQTEILGILSGMNSSELTQLLDDAGLGELLGDPSDGGLGGLRKPKFKPKQKRQYIPDVPAGSTSAFQGFEAGYLNWTAYEANLTKEFGASTTLCYMTYNGYGYQLDFQPFSGEWPTDGRICQAFSTNFVVNISLVMCVAQAPISQSLPIQTPDTGPGTEPPVSNILGGISICDPTGFFSTNCTPGLPTMQYSTIMTLSEAYATTAYSIDNATILSLHNISKPVAYPVNLSDYFIAFSAPLIQSTLIQVLEEGNPDVGSETTVTQALAISLAADFAYAGAGPSDGFHQLRNLMAYAIVSASSQQEEYANSGPQAIAKLVYTLQIAKGALISYIVLGSFVLVWCVAVVGWSVSRIMPNTSSFPEVDFVAKWTAQNGVGEGVASGVGGQMDGLTNAVSRRVVDKLGLETEVFVGEAKGGSSIGLDTSPLETLRRGVGYY